MAINTALFYRIALQKLVVVCPVYKSPQLDTILSQCSLIQSFTTYASKIHFSIILLLGLGFATGLSNQLCKHLSIATLNSRSTFTTTTTTTTTIVGLDVPNRNFKDFNIFNFEFNVETVLRSARCASATSAIDSDTGVCSTGVRSGFTCSTVYLSCRCVYI